MAGIMVAKMDQMKGLGARTGNVIQITGNVQITCNVSRLNMYVTDGPHIMERYMDVKIDLMNTINCVAVRRMNGHARMVRDVCLLSQFVMV